MNLFDIVNPDIPVVEPSSWGWIAIGAAVFLGVVFISVLIFKNRRK